MRIEVHNGEIFDKFSILEIKEEHGLVVSKEKQLLKWEFDLLTDSYPESLYLYEVLKSINEQLWEIEDAKRACEYNKDFGERFIALARLVYLINDERAKIKRHIDVITNSEILEIKGHAGL